jgi:drug/metabolite transporter (DMT)-like permease
VQTSPFRKSLTEPGIVAALVAALLFGAGTPLAKLLLKDISPWLMAALLYLGSGIGLGVYRLIRRSPSVRLAPGDWPWLAGAIFMGGVVGPGLQMLGLTQMPASAPVQIASAAQTVGAERGS